jgi:hypothetical protein
MIKDRTASSTFRRRCPAETGCHATGIACHNCRKVRSQLSIGGAWRACDLIMRLHVQFGIAVSDATIDGPQRPGFLACEPVRRRRRHACLLTCKSNGHTLTSIHDGQLQPSLTLSLLGYCAKLHLNVIYPCKIIPISSIGTNTATSEMLIDSTVKADLRGACDRGPGAPDSR